MCQGTATKQLYMYKLKQEYRTVTHDSAIMVAVRVALSLVYPTLAAVIKLWGDHRPYIIMYAKHALAIGNTGNMAMVP
jgi:hypothetical protein